MIYRFPHDVAYLPRTKLSYINLPGLLSDAKRDRTARVSGFVAIQLGERCYLVFLRDGDPFHAARIDPHGRAATALSEVLRIAATESERGENGQIGFFGAPQDQLLAMLSTLVAEPVAWDEPLDATKPDQLFPRLRERRFCGVVELRDGPSMHYLSFEDGGFRCGYFSDRPADVAVAEQVRGVFQGASGLRVTLYPPLRELPIQAGPGLVDLYRRIIGGVMREVAGPLGREAGFDLIRRGQSAAVGAHPAIAAFDVTDEGRVRGDPVATPAELTDGMAAWVTEVLISASDHHGIDPAAVVERTARDSRFVLAEHGFFQRLPWTVAL